MLHTRVGNRGALPGAFFLCNSVFEFLRTRERMGASVRRLSESPPQVTKVDTALRASSLDDMDTLSTISMVNLKIRERSKTYGFP